MITAARARKLAEAIKTNLAQLEQNIHAFHAAEAWVALGYESFTEWWDNELHGVPIATGLRNWAIYMMEAEARPAGALRLPSGAIAQVADALGVTHSVVQSVLSRKRYANRKTNRTDDDMVFLGFGVPNRWRRHIIKTAVDHNANMADILRPVVADGMRSRYGVNVDAEIAPTRRRATARR